MINAIRKFYYHNDLVSNDYNYSFMFSYSHSSSRARVTIRPSLSDAIKRYGDYYVKIVIILICQTALNKDYPNYVFNANLRNTFFNEYSNSGNRATITTAEKVSIYLNNGFFGISAYFFYNSR